jgi:hypothetical protein
MKVEIHDVLVRQAKEAAQEGRRELERRAGNSIDYLRQWWSEQTVMSPPPNDDALHNLETWFTQGMLVVRHLRKKDYDTP